MSEAGVRLASDVLWRGRQAVAGNRPWMPSGEKRPPADKKCTTPVVMLTVPSGVRARRDDPGFASDAARRWWAWGDVSRGAPPLQSAHETTTRAAATIANRRSAIPI